MSCMDGGFPGWGKVRSLRKGKGRLLKRREGEMSGGRERGIRGVRLGMEDAGEGRGGREHGARRERITASWIADEWVACMREG